MPEITLKAKTAKAARSEIAGRFPQGASYLGYDRNGDCVLISLVRPKGSKAPVASARANRGLSPVTFTCKPLGAMP